MEEERLSNLKVIKVNKFVPKIIRRFFKNDFIYNF